MDKPRVDTDNLRAMATRWAALGGKASAGAPPSHEGLPCQATSIAVKAGHATTQAATSALTARAVASATRVSAVDTAYLTPEARSTLMIGAIAGAPSRH